METLLCTAKYKEEGFAVYPAGVKEGPSCCGKPLSLRM